MSSQQDGTSANPPSKTPFFPIWPNGIAKIKCYLHKRRTERHKENAQDRFGRRTANATTAIAWLAVVAAVVGSLQYCSIQGQLDETRAEQRPWVYASEIAIAGRIISDDEHGVYAIPLKFSIINTGHLPAFSVLPKTSAAVLKVGQSSLSISNDVCDAFRNSLDKGGMTVFAGQTVTHGGFTVDDYPYVSKEIWRRVANDRLIVMYGCIDYQFPAEPGHHQSRFAFAVGASKNQGILERIGSLPDDPTTVDVRMLRVTINDGTQAN